MKRVLKDLACHDNELSILFTDDAGIARLNKAYLNKNGSTNVLAFPMAGGPSPEIQTGMLGDVVISVDTALRESYKQDVSLEETIDHLLVHGLLHLLGYDHERSVHDAHKMQEEEKRLMKIIKELS